MKIKEYDLIFIHDVGLETAIIISILMIDENKKRNSLMNEFSYNQSPSGEGWLYNLIKLYI